MLFVPLVASAQFRDLDAAMSNLERGFGGGDVDAIVSGIGADDQVMLQFPGLADKSGFFGRDQAAYLLDGLFNKVKPSGFERVSARKVQRRGAVPHHRARGRDRRRADRANLLHHAAPERTDASGRSVVGTRPHGTTNGINQLRVSQP